MSQPGANTPAASSGRWECRSVRDDLQPASAGPAATAAGATIAVTVSSSARNPLPVSVQVRARTARRTAGRAVIRQIVRRSRLGTRCAVHSISSRWSVLGKKSGAVTSE